MPRLSRVSMLVLLALALVACAGPAAAHVVSPPPPATLAEVDADPIIPVLSGAPAPPALPWYLPAALALGAAVAWRRPRRVLVVALVLLLCALAFEHALHSVHHGFDAQQQQDCAVAAASAHLAAVPADGVALVSLVLPVMGRADDTPPNDAPTRFLSPDQGRAPPSALL